MNTNPLQLRFLQHLRAMLPPHQSFADELADVLGISPDSAYRRLRGETDLSIEQVATLCRHYRVSFDSFLSDYAGGVTFHYNLLSTEADFAGYLRSFRDTLARLRGQPQARVLYAAADVPIFHHFQFPEHAAFKMFYWMQSVMGIPQRQGQRFAPAAIDPALIALGHEIYQHYQQVPPVEVWAESSAASTVQQMEYYWEAGLFEGRAEALLVAEQYLALLEQVRRQAELGRKLPHAGPENYQLYYSEITVGNNCVLVANQDARVVYLRHQTFNTMTTTNLNFCQETDVFFKNMIKRSVLISGVSARQRYQFFQKIAQPARLVLDRIRRG